ncbi:hypothetical protein NE237_007933 [Protea cynaroides]|uniref:RCD1 WWE domain-containing protein n=1 Tax=Protea cynaroides TaxID=273540 RepID=A0A9Q0QWY8_9MAGN|nr:hypothetical protein NE237_007933 [Protea cynaroides]
MVSHMWMERSLRIHIINNCLYVLALVNDIKVDVVARFQFVSLREKRTSPKFTMDRVPPPPCFGCRNAFCFFCTRYPGGLCGPPRRLMYFDNNKWLRIPSCIYPMVMSCFLRRQPIFHVHGYNSHIVDFERMIIYNTRTGDYRIMAWREALNSSEEHKGNCNINLDLTLKLGFDQPNQNQEIKREGYNQLVNNEANSNGPQMQEDRDDVESCGSNEDILEANFNR